MFLDALVEMGESVFGAEGAASDLVHPAIQPPAVAPTCGPAHPTHPTVAPTATMPNASPAITGAPGEQLGQANTLFQEIQDGISSEDATRCDGGQPTDQKSHTTASQLPANAVSHVQTLQAAAARDPSQIGAYVAAVHALEQQYLSTPMYSSDDPHDAIHAPAAESMTLAEYQALTPAQRHDQFGDQPVKFAMTASGEMRVGPQSLSHAQIAGGPALSAGQMHDDGTGHLQDLENTSGGFRPGALRNNTALAAFDQAHMIGRAGATSYQNPTGSYDDSSTHFFGPNETPGVNVLPTPPPTHR